MNNYLKHGLEALSVGEWEKAKSLIEKSLKIEKSAEAFEALARVAWWLNDSAEVFENRRKAYSIYHSENNNAAASRMASWIGLDHLEFRGELAVATGWFERAENLLDGLGVNPELCLIRILKARIAFVAERDAKTALEISEESLKLSKSINFVEGIMIAEALKGFILVNEGRVSEGMPLLDDATVLALTAGSSDINMIVNTCCFLIDACNLIKDYERAGQWCIKVKEICERWNYKAMFASCRTQYASVLIWRGEWKEAEQELLAAAKELKQYRPIQVESSIIRLADLRRRQGKYVESEELFNEVQYHWLKPLACAELAFEKGNPEQALNLTERYLRKIPAQEQVKKTEGLELLIRITVHLNKTKEAESALNELKVIVNDILTLPLKAALFNSEGIYQNALHNYITARRKLEDAIDIYDKIISPFEAARSRIHLSDVLLKMNLSDEAEAELNTAIKIFKDLGAERYYQNSKNLIGSIQAQRKKTGADIFTKREIEVLKLISEGKNNEDISQQLFVSIRTVEKHTTNIYQKLGISGKSARAYAASFAVKNKILF